MADLDHIKINGSSIVRPVELKLEREDIYAAEITTMTGKVIADKVGWKYADMTLNWKALPQSSIEVLLAMDGANEFEFDDPSGDTLTENVIRTSVVQLRHPYKIDNVTWWRDVSVTIKFISAHN